MMQVKWGNYSFAAGSCRFGVRQKAELDSRQIPYLYNIDIDVQGKLYGEGDDTLSLLEVALRSALSVPFQNFGVLKVSGGNSGTFFLNRNTLGGIYVSAGPDFTGTQATEYVLFREFNFTVTMKIPLLRTANALLSFSESLEFSGGGPDFVHKRAMNGAPQKQMVWLQTEYRVVQKGSAVGFLKRPQPARILFPGDFKTSPVIAEDAPDRVGNDYYKYGVSWNYVFESASPLIALPNVWTG